MMPPSLPTASLVLDGRECVAAKNVGWQSAAICAVATYLNRIFHPPCSARFPDTLCSSPPHCLPRKTCRRSSSNASRRWFSSALLGHRAKLSCWCASSDVCVRPQTLGGISVMIPSLTWGLQQRRWSLLTKSSCHSWACWCPLWFEQLSSRCRPWRVG